MVTMLGTKFSFRSSDTTCKRRVLFNKYKTIQITTKQIRVHIFKKYQLFVPLM